MSAVLSCGNCGEGPVEDTAPWEPPLCGACSRLDVVVLGVGNDPEGAQALLSLSAVWNVAGTRPHARGTLLVLSRKTA